MHQWKNPTTKKETITSGELGEVSEGLEKLSNLLRQIHLICLGPTNAYRYQEELCNWGNSDQHPEGHSHKME